MKAQTLGAVFYCLAALVYASKYLAPSTWPAVGYVALAVAALVGLVAAVRLTINR